MSGVHSLSDTRRSLLSGSAEASGCHVRFRVPCVVTGDLGGGDGKMHLAETWLEKGGLAQPLWVPAGHAG